MAWEDHDDAALLRAVQNSSPELLAHHLRSHDKHVRELHQDYQDKLAHLRSQLTLAQKIGGAVLKARRAGRKTIRLAELPVE